MVRECSIVVDSKRVEAQLKDLGDSSEKKKVEVSILRDGHPCSDKHFLSLSSYKP
jgi:hypothetical protein